MLTATSIIVLIAIWLIIGAVSLIGLVIYHRDENNYLYIVSTRMLTTAVVVTSLLSWILMLEYNVG